MRPNRDPRRIGYTCSAFLKVTTDQDGSVHVDYCCDHNHPLRPEQLPLSKAVKQVIGALLTEGLETRQIIDRMKQHESQKSSRLYYLRPIDVDNVRKTEKIFPGQLS